MTPVPIEFTQGESVTISLDLTDETDQPLNIADATFDAAVRNFEDLETVLAVFACTPDVANSKVVLSLTPEQTIDIPYTIQYTAKGAVSSTPAALLFYDCFKTQGGVRQVILAGSVTVKAAMSRIA